MVTFVFALFTGENLSCVSLVGARGLMVSYLSVTADIHMSHFSNFTKSEGFMLSVGWLRIVVFRATLHECLSVSLRFWRSQAEGFLSYFLIFTHK